MKVEVLYKCRGRELFHSLQAYPNLFLAIIVNPLRRGEVNYLRMVEIEESPIPVVKTRMLREVPFGYVSQREAVLLPREPEIRKSIHPLLLEPFPDELSIIGDEVLLRRKTEGQEFLYDCMVEKVENVDFPIMKEYVREVNGKKENFVLKKIEVE